MRKARRLLLLILLALPATTLPAQESNLEANLEAILRFEAPPVAGAPGGWGGGPAGTIHLDETVVHAGRGAARLERDAASESGFSSLTHHIPIDFTGEQIELRGFLRSAEVAGAAGLWLRQDGLEGAVRFTSMLVEERGVAGTTEWSEYSVRLPQVEEARVLFFGVLLRGEGKVWADDLSLWVDGKPLAEAPRRELETTVLDTDREFLDGSGIDLTTLTPTQVEIVALLGQVWGFLKYHHPRVAAGELHWDFELFRILPRVLAAPDAVAGRAILMDWVKALGIPDDCDPCARPSKGVHLEPRLDWLEDEALLGAELAAALKTIHAHRFAGGESFYLSQVPGVGNPVFEHELGYPRQRPPDAGYRILALLRLWTMIEYWFPYRDLLDDDWNAVLREFLPRLVAAQDWDGYRLEMLALIARIRDTHANLWSALDVRPPRGDCRWPVALRFVEGRATVTALTDGEKGKASGLEIGDVLLAVGGRTVEDLVEEWSPYYAASNPPTRLRDIARFLPRGPCGPAKVTIERGGTARELTVERLPDLERRPPRHDRPGETFQLLSDKIAYLKLSSIRVQDLEGYLKQARGTRGLVIDIRNYPSEFVVFALGSRLVQVATPFARFTKADATNPGAFTWTEPVVLQPQEPLYRGKVAILVDESSISQSEYTAMALSAGPHVVVGSTTAGADGNVSRIVLPGGLRTGISGIGVFYPDKTPTQRVGIVPDIVATPTREGIRQGRDEVLEAALRHLLGPEVAEAEIIEMACTPSCT